MTIDLSILAPPAVVESIDFEIIFAARKARFLELVEPAERESYAARLELESDPVVKLLQENSYREIILRQRINDAAHAVMLAYATGADLDQIGGNYGVPRLLVDAGNATAIPPIVPTWEADEDYRERILLSLDSQTTAGSRNSYVFHARSASGQVRSATAESTLPGYVTVYILSQSGDGTASEQLINTVIAALNVEDVRPMSDNVAVLSASIINYAIEAHLAVESGPDSEVIRAAANTAATAYASACHKLNIEISLSGIYRALHQPGVTRVDLTSPAANIPVSRGQAAYCTGITITAGVDGG